jgi:hypothetical protein
MTSRETRESAKQRSGSKMQEKAPPRKSEPGGHLSVPSKKKAGSKSAGNSPNSSPLLNNSVLSRQHQLGYITHRRNVKDSLNESEILDVESVHTKSDTPIKVTTPDGKKGKTLATGSPKHDSSDSDNCPCHKDCLKGSFLVKCCRCLQSWHPECSNLCGITQAAAKKLRNWSCLRCVIIITLGPNEQILDDKEALSQFHATASDIRKYTEDLKDSATSVDFFNTHIKHLLLNEDEFKSHSAKIEKLEKNVEDIKSMLTTALMKEENTKNADNERELDIMKEITEIKELLKSSKQGLESPGDENFLNLVDVKATIESINKCGSEMENSSKSLSEELQWLKDVFKPEGDEDNPVPERSIFKHIDQMISEMNTQLKSINEHVCPNQNAQRSLAINGEAVIQSEEESIQLAMTPNTRSPHFVSPEPSYVSPPCEPFLQYTEEVVPQDLKNRLTAFMTESQDDFKSIGGSRDTLYFGEFGYFYTGAYHEARQTPPVVQELLDKVRPTLPDEHNNTWLNSCLITRYPDRRSSIPLHQDNENFIDPDSVIVTVSMGDTRTLKFVNKNKEEKELNLKDGSMYLMTRFSQDHWQHCIDPEETVTQVNQDNSDNQGVDETVQSNVRFSFTFRHVAPHFKNSTVIIGDSNTQNIKFGRSIGTLGKWVPGKRIKASKIEHIPPPHEIGPFSNIVLHTGINNISDDNNRRSNKSLIGLLKQRCDDIQACYPASKLHVSLLLPTKSSYVNGRVSELNSLILDMCFNRKNTFVIDNSLLSSDRGLLPAHYGRYLYNGSPNSSDIVHLGREGIKQFCKNIKRCIIHKGASQSRERFNGSRGNYRDAAAAGGRRGDISSG